VNKIIAVAKTFIVNISSWFWNKLGWLINHGIAMAIAIVAALSFRWLVKNWQHPTVIASVNNVSSFVDVNLSFIEPALTLTVFIIAKSSGRVIRHYKKGSMALTAGMFLYSHNADDKEVKKSERFLKKEGMKCAHIHILGASGWDTFGKADSPLHDGLRTCNEVQVILLSPSSEALIRRAADIGQNANDYKIEIYKSIEYLRELRELGDNPERIKLKMYRSYPMWKYIILGRYLWIQQYPPDCHVRLSPCYGFQKVSRGAGIYGNVFTQFQRRWVSYRLGIYNFDTDLLEFYNEDAILIEKQRIRD